MNRTSGNLPAQKCQSEFEDRSRFLIAGALRDTTKITGILLPMAAGSIVGAMIGGLVVGLVSFGTIKALLGVVLMWSAWKCFRHVGNATTMSDSQPATDFKNA